MLILVPCSAAAGRIAFAARFDLGSLNRYLVTWHLRMERGCLRDAETIARGVIAMDRLPVVMHLPRCIKNAAVAAF